MNDGYEYAKLSAGTIRYRDIGDGEPVVFLHGLLVNGNLWRDVVPPLADDVRCIVPDLPLGGHSIPMPPGTPLSPPDIADLVVDFLDSLDLERVTLVGNDTGGAICQLVVAEHPERVERLVLTNCDSFRNFLPPILRVLQWGAHLPGFTFAVVQAMRLQLVRTVIERTLAKHPIPDAVTDTYFDPSVENAAVRRDLRTVLAGISPRQTMAAAASFPTFEKPVLIAWAPEDRYLFPLKYGTRLSELFPNARLELVEDSYAFVPEDRPERLADLVRSFVTET